MAGVAADDPLAAACTPIGSPAPTRTPERPDGGPTRARTLTREAQLRAAMPVTDRIQETSNAAAHRLAQPPPVQESPTRPPRARIHDRYLDHYRISDRGRGYDLGR